MKHKYKVTANISATVELIVEAQDAARAEEQANISLTGGEVAIDWREEGYGVLSIDFARDFDAQEEDQKGNQG